MTNNKISWNNPSPQVVHPSILRALQAPTHTTVHLFGNKSIDPSQVDRVPDAAGNSCGTHDASRAMADLASRASFVFPAHRLLHQWRFAKSNFRNNEQ
ncbi:hypothetical protein WA026_002213 [Henosepilachna vigintioctopunctata]|uniref:Uncharacterized protein n=1 Tax=Henosepilachna vigintioctopunctata TaxID=420089 RepID=A0AAW1U1P5_9CUCU